MSLERRYARLLALYPEPFRSAQAGEMLGVLMAGASDGRRRPLPREYADVLKSALGVRLRTMGQPLKDALALFSFLAPLFVLVLYLLEAAFPYHSPAQVSSIVAVARQSGGQAIIDLLAFRAVLISQVLIAVLALAGLRWVTLAALAATTAACGVVLATGFLPGQVQVIAASFAILETAALIASPGPRHGRYLVHWGYGVVLLLLAAAVEVSVLAYQAAQPDARLITQGPRSLAWGYVAVSCALTAAALVVVPITKLGWRFLPLLAALLYPYAVILATTPPASSGSDLIGSPTPMHLTLLFLPSLLLACYLVVKTLLNAPHRRAAETISGLAAPARSPALPGGTR